MSTCRTERLARPSNLRRRKSFGAVPLLVLILAAVALLSGAATFGADAYAVDGIFSGSELLGRPTNDSVSIKIVPSAAIQLSARTLRRLVPSPQRPVSRTLQS